RSDVIGNWPEFPFVGGAPPGQAADGVGEAGRVAGGPGRIEWFNGKPLRRTWRVGEHPDNAIGLKIKRAGPVRNDRKFELVGVDGNAIQPLLEEIGARRRIEREHLLAHRCGQLWVYVVEGEDDVDGLGVEARGDSVEIGEVETQEAAGKREIVAHEVKPAEQVIVVRDQRLALAEADLSDHLGVAGGDDRVAESVENAKVNARAMCEQLLVERHRIGFLAEQVEAERFHPVGGEPQLWTGLRFFVGGLIFSRYRAAHGQLKPEARGAAGASVWHQSLEGAGTRQILRLDDIEGPERDRLRERKPACNVALCLPIGRVEHSALRDGPPVAERRIAKFWLCANENERRGRREIVWRKLVDEVRGEIGELMLELELDSGGEERGALEKSGDHRVGGVADESAKALGDARVVLSEFGRLLAQDRELLVIEPQEFAVHRSEPFEPDLTGVELHFGYELHRNLDRLRLQCGADEKPHPQFAGRHRLVTTRLDRAGEKPWLEVAKRNFDLARDAVRFVLVDRSVR